MRWHPPLGVSRAIVAGMAGSTGAATSAGDPTPSTSSASPLSILAQSTIAARDTEAKEGDPLDESSGIPSAPEEEEPFSGAGTRMPNVRVYPHTRGSPNLLPAMGFMRAGGQ